MWFIFLLSCIAVALAALLVIWIGSKVFRSIEKQERDSQIRAEMNEQIKKKIRSQLEEKK